jgi:hypothetical protein
MPYHTITLHYIHTYIHPHMHASMLPCIHACMHPSMHPSFHPSIYLCLYGICIIIYMLFLCVCDNPCMHVQVYLCISLSLLINIPKYVPSSVVISGTWTGGADNIQRPKGYVKEYPHGLVRYSSSILRSWTSHWLLMASKHHGHSVFPVHPGIPFFDAFIIPRKLVAGHTPKWRYKLQCKIWHPFPQAVAIIYYIISGLTTCFYNSPISNSCPDPIPNPLPIIPHPSRWFFLVFLGTHHWCKPNISQHQPK